MQNESALHQLRQARHAFIRWWQYAQGIVSGTAIGTKSNPVEHTECVAGKWLHGQGKELLGHIPQFHAVLEAHALLHELHEQIHHLVRHDQHEHAQRKWKDSAGVYHSMLDTLTFLEQTLLEEEAPARCA
jgi:hypothetical protein